MKINLFLNNGFVSIYYNTKWYTGQTSHVVMDESDRRRGFGVENIYTTTINRPDGKLDFRLYTSATDFPLVAEVDRNGVKYQAGFKGEIALDKNGNQFLKFTTEPFDVCVRNVKRKAELMKQQSDLPY